MGQKYRVPKKLNLTRKRKNKPKPVVPKFFFLTHSHLTARQIRGDAAAQISLFMVSSQTDDVRDIRTHVLALKFAARLILRACSQTFKKQQAGSRSTSLLCLR